MSDTQKVRHPQRTTALIVGMLVVVIAAVTAIGLLTAGSASPGPSKVAPAVATTMPVEPTTTPTPSTATPTTTPTPVRTTTAPAAPTPQPTKTAAISKPTAVPIKKELTASVVKTEAVAGQADGPGEIAGPSVRFTIKITNTTGAAIQLSSTVVNAYYGSAATPAVQLRMPGGVDFPTSVANDASATGVFVFNIPESDRSDVKVTVDTSVRNPVIAFQGPTPRG